MPFTVQPPDGGAASADVAKDARIAALLREREGYLNRGRLDRVEQVDAVLISEGFELVERAVDPPTPRDRATKSKG